MRDLTHELMAAGSAGAMITPPNMLPTDEQMTHCDRQAVEAVGAELQPAKSLVVRGRAPAGIAGLVPVADGHQGYFRPGAGTCVDRLRAAFEGAARGA